jgi:hypothetical protein
LRFAFFWSAALHRRFLLSFLECGASAPLSLVFRVGDNRGEKHKTNKAAGHPEGPAALQKRQKPN